MINARLQLHRGKKISPRFVVAANFLLHFFLILLHTLVILKRDGDGILESDRLCDDKEREEEKPAYGSPEKLDQDFRFMKISL